MTRLLITLSLFSVLFSHSQDFTNRAGGLYHDESFDIEVDENNNTYTTGYTGNDCTFGASIQQNNNGYSDIYVAKNDANGNFVWNKNFGGNLADRGLDLAVDQNGNVYVTGYFAGQASFDNTTLTSNNNSQDIFIVKLDNNGNVIWAISDGGPEAETSYAIHVDDNNDVIIAGQYEGTTSIGGINFTANTNPITSQGTLDMFVAKYDNLGSPVWSISGNSNYDNRVLAIDSDVQNNVYISGQFSDTLTFNNHTEFNTGLNFGFISKISSTGNVDWFRKIHASQCLAYDLELDNNEDLITTGEFQGSLYYYDTSGVHTLTPWYSNNLFVLKTTANGDFIWSNSVGSESTISSKAIAIDNSGDAYISGTFSCVLDQFRDSLSTGVWNSVGYKDIFTMKFSTNGSRLWATHTGGPLNDYCSGIALKNGTSPIISGSFENNISYQTSSNMLTPNGIGMNYINSNTSFCSNQSAILGDASKDIFILSPEENVSQPLFYYLNPNCSDSVASQILPSLDSLSACVDDTLYADKGSSWNQFNPYFDAYWNNTLGENEFHVTQTGTYTLRLERQDQCAIAYDTVYVQINQPPTALELTDNLGFNSNQLPPYNPITVCNPDSVNLNFQTLLSNHSLEFSGNNFLSTNPVFDLTTEGEFSVIVTDSNNCSAIEELIFTQEDSLHRDSIIPYLKLQDLVDFNDSIEICANENVRVYLLDSITNPTGQFEQWQSPFIAEYFETSIYSEYITKYDTSKWHVFDFTPMTSGWYTIDAWINTGWLNECGEDTLRYNLTDSFYVQVNPLPIFNYSLDGENQICQDGILSVWTTNANPSFQWTSNVNSQLYGNGIFNINNTSDTILVSSEGIYFYGGTITDSITGCSQDFTQSFQVFPKDIPLVSMFPLDGIICPGDSVELTAETGVAYNWIGPSGNSIGNNQTLFVEQSGFYHCVVTDSSGCPVTSNTAEVKEYSSPVLNIAPDEFICTSDPVTLTAAITGTANILWTPTNETTSSITVDSAGVYFCEVEQCGFTAIDSVIIYDVSFTPQISVSDTILCFGDVITITTNSGMQDYDWNSVSNNSSVIQITQPGDYFVTLTNQFDCTATTDTITIIGNSAPFPPLFSDTIVCLDASLSFTNSGPNTIQWFLSDFQSPISSNNTISFSSIDSSFSVLYSVSQGICPNYNDSIEVELSTIYTGVDLNFDTILCSGEDLNLIGDSTFIYSGWTGPNGFTNNSVSTILYGVTNTDAGYYYYHFADDYCLSYDSIEVIIHDNPTMNLNIDSLLFCTDTTFQLFDTSGNNLSYEWTTNTGVYSNNDTLNVLNGMVNSNVINVTGIDVNGCSSPAESVIVLQNYTPIEIFFDDFFCEGSQVGLYHDGNFLAQSYWLNPAGDTLFGNELILDSITTQDNGVYTFEGIDLFGCSYSDTDFVYLAPLDTFNLGNDTVICNSLFTGIEGPTTNSTWAWSDGTNNPYYFPSSDTSWIVIEIYNSNGCDYIDSMLLIIENCQTSAANVVTANGDGTNDYFTIFEAEKWLNSDLYIKNRWGQIVYSSVGYQNNYNCADLTEGVYFYEFNTDPSNEDSQKISGFFHVIR